MNLKWILLIVIVAIGSYLAYSPNQQHESVASPTEVVERNQADLFGKDVRFNQLHQDGQLHYRLHATSIRQFDDEQLTQMTDPKFHLRSATQAPWDIDANEGFISKKEAGSGTLEDVIFLRKAVQMEQHNPTNGRITLRSEAIYIYPDRQLAESQQDVIIDTEVGRTTAAGLSANLDSGFIKLSSSATQRVHTIVLPEQFKKD